MKIVFFCLICAVSLFVRAQDSVRVVVLLDSVRQSRGILDLLDPEDMAMIHIWKGEDVAAKGYEGMDGVIEIITRAYQERPDSLLQIPLLSSLSRRGQKWYQGEELYTGPVADYYISGHLKMRGEMKEGGWQGCVETFYPNGKPQKQEFWEKGEKTGAFASWYPEGEPECLSVFSAGNKEWEQTCKYSDGRLKYTAHRKKGNWKYDGSWERIWKLLAAGKKYAAEGKEEKASACFTQAIRIDDRCAEAYYERAKVGWKQGKKEAALYDIAFALLLDPGRMEWYWERACYVIEKYKDKEEETVNGIADIKNFPPDIQKGIIHDLKKAYTVLKGKNLLLHRMLWQYTNKKLNVTPQPAAQ